MSGIHATYEAGGTGESLWRVSPGAGVGRSQIVSDGLIVNVGGDEVARSVAKMTETADSSGKAGFDNKDRVAQALAVDEIVGHLIERAVIAPLQWARALT